MGMKARAFVLLLVLLATTASLRFLWHFSWLWSLTPLMVVFAVVVLLYLIGKALLFYIDDPLEEQDFDY